MILRIDRIQIELPPPSTPDPTGVAANDGQGVIDKVKDAVT
jgi:hypothetical protein